MSVPVDHIAVHVYGARNQLLGHVRVPASDVPQFIELLGVAQTHNPSHTAGTLVRWMVKLGCAAAARAIRSGSVPQP